MLVFTEEAMRHYERDHSSWKLLLCFVGGYVRVHLRHWKPVGTKARAITTEGPR